MLYAIMCIDDYGDVVCYAIRETFDAAESYVVLLNEAEEDFHWTVPIEDDGGIGEFLENGDAEEPE